MATAPKNATADTTGNDVVVSIPHKKSVATSWFWKAGNEEQVKGFRKGIVDGSVTVGQIIGQVFAIGSRSLEDSETGEVKDSRFLQGMFEVGSDITGFKATTATLYAPGYFIDELEAQLKVPGIQSIMIAHDLVAEKSDKTPVGYAWTMTPLVERGYHDPLEEIKRALLKTKKLRLSAPVARPVAAIEEG